MASKGELSEVVCVFAGTAPLTHCGMSSNLIPVTNSGKAETKPTNQPEHLHSIASELTSVHWDAKDGKDKDTSPEQ